MADEKAWDDPVWREHDTEWAVGCRWLQAWWRATALHADPGALSTKRHDRLVASMLPIDSDPALNFLGPEIVAAVEARLAEGEHSGIIQRDRLYRNLLSSQPACFNLFGHFHEEPNRLLPWVRGLDPDATSVKRIRFEWAPDRARHFGGGSAFDAFIEYGIGTSLGFLGVECKYAEDLRASTISVREPYFEFTTDSHGWREGAAQRLDQPNLRQFWLNTLLAQSLAEKDSRYERGTVVVTACATDRAAREATALVRMELHEPERWLRWSPYEELLWEFPPAFPLSAPPGSSGPHRECARSTPR